MSSAVEAQDDPEFLAAYEEEDRILRIRFLVVVVSFGIATILLGALLDWVVYPEMHGRFFAIRVGVDVLLTPILLVLLFTRDRLSLSVSKLLGVLATELVCVSFCLMIFLTDGAHSPYYAGINLVILFMSTLLPWTWIETAIVCGIALFFYVLACVFNPTFSAEASSILFNNIYFLVLTTAICVTSTFYRTRARFADFRLRHRLDVQNQELQDLNQKLQDLDRLKTQFFSNVSHELRTPLTLILGPVETMLGRADAFDGKVHENLIMVHRNTLRLLKLINDLLDLTRLDQGVDMLRKSSVTVGPYVKGIVDSIRHLGMSKNLRIRVEEGSRNTAMTVDPGRMEKVLINLLTNAIKYTPVGGAVTVGWKNGNGGVAIEVKDTGVGIPEDDLARVFDRFHQVRSNAANQNQGVGIGLALVKELVEAHGGRIEVQSQPAQGSVFTLHFPA